MNGWLCIGLVTLALGLSPVVADAGTRDATSSNDGTAAKQRRRARRHGYVGNTVANAFRTAGNAVAYGVHSTGRAVTGGRAHDRESERAEHYQRRMERSAGATRDSARSR